MCLWRNTAESSHAELDLFHFFKIKQEVWGRNLYTHHQNQNHQFLVKNTRNSLSLKLFTGTHCLPTFTQAAAQLRGRCGFKADARPPGASGSVNSQNQPTTPPILNQTARQNQGSTGPSGPNPQA